VADDLALALELADLADAITMGRYRAEDLAVDTKPDLTPVTEADRAVEQALREHLARERPGDGVVGEEYGGDGTGEAARRWIVDPIDGTKSYVRGMPTWATLIALAVHGEGMVGVVSAPAAGRRWWAERDRGAFADGRPIRVSTIAALGDAQLVWGGIEDWDALGRFDALLELGRRCWRTRGVGDSWQYMLVAEGAVDIGGLDLATINCPLKSVPQSHPSCSPAEHVQFRNPGGVGAKEELAQRRHGHGHG